jgi:LAS superfamily LD-carboxypeptidase LdcB
MPDQNNGFDDQSKLDNLKQPRVLGPVSGVSKINGVNTREGRSKEEVSESDIRAIVFELSKEHILNNVAGFITGYFGSSQGIINTALQVEANKAESEYENFVQNHELDDSKRQSLGQFRRIFSSQFQPEIIRLLLTPREFQQGADKLVLNSGVIKRFIAEVNTEVSQTRKTEISDFIRKGAPLAQTLERYIQETLNSTAAKWGAGEYFGQVYDYLFEDFRKNYIDELIKQYDRYVPTAEEIAEEIEERAEKDKKSETTPTPAASGESSETENDGKLTPEVEKEGEKSGNVEENDSDDVVNSLPVAENNGKGQEQGADPNTHDTKSDTGTKIQNGDNSQQDKTPASPTAEETAAKKAAEDEQKAKEEAARKQMEKWEWEDYLKNQGVTNDDEFADKYAPKEEEKPDKLPGSDEKIVDKDKDYKFKSLQNDRFSEVQRNDKTKKNGKRLEEAENLRYQSKLNRLDGKDKAADHGEKQANKREWDFVKYNQSGSDRIRGVLNTAGDARDKRLDEARAARKAGDETRAKLLEKKALKSNKLAQGALDALPKENIADNLVNRLVKELVKQVVAFLLPLIPWILIFALVFLTFIISVLEIYCRPIPTIRDTIEAGFALVNPGATVANGFRSELRARLEDSGLCKAYNPNFCSEVSTEAGSGGGGTTAGTYSGGSFCFDKALAGKTQIQLWRANNGLKQDSSGLISTDKIKEVVAAGKEAGVPDYITAWVITLAPTESSFRWDISGGPYDCYGIIQFCRAPGAGRTYQRISKIVYNRDVPTSEFISNKAMQMKFAEAEWNDKKSQNCRYARDKGDLYLVSYAHLGCVRPGGGDGNTKSTDYGEAAIRNAALFECDKIAAAVKPQKQTTVLDQSDTLKLLANLKADNNLTFTDDTSNSAKLVAKNIGYMRDFVVSNFGPIPVEAVDDPSNVSIKVSSSACCGTSGGGSSNSTNEGGETSIEGLCSTASSFISTFTANQGKFEGWVGGRGKRDDVPNRCNNPGNINAASWALKLVDQKFGTGKYKLDQPECFSGKNKHVWFETPEAGMYYYQLFVYNNLSNPQAPYDKAKTIGDWLNIYCPPTDRCDKNYIKNVLSGITINNTPVNGSTSMNDIKSALKCGQTTNLITAQSASLNFISSEIAPKTDDFISTTGQFFSNFSGNINVQAATRPTSYNGKNGLSEKHKAFLKEVAKINGDSLFKDAGSDNAEAKAAFDKMAAAYPGGMKIVSSYRGYDSQIPLFFSTDTSNSKIIPDSLIFTDNLAPGSAQYKAVFEAYKGRAEQSAPPGYSEHHTGLTFDINSVSKSEWASSPALQKLYTWLKTNASKYGFTQSFPESRGTRFEHWHWRYDGTTAGTKLIDSLVLDQNGSKYYGAGNSSNSGSGNTAANTKCVCPPGTSSAAANITNSNNNKVLEPENINQVIASGSSDNPMNAMLNQLFGNISANAQTAKVSNKYTENLSGDLTISNNYDSNNQILAGKDKAFPGTPQYFIMHITGGDLSASGYEQYFFTTIRGADGGYTPFVIGKDGKTILLYDANKNWGEGTLGVDKNGNSKNEAKIRAITSDGKAGNILYSGNGKNSVDAVSIQIEMSSKTGKDATIAQATSAGKIIAASGIQPDKLLTHYAVQPGDRAFDNPFIQRDGTVDSRLVTLVKVVRQYNSSWKSGAYAGMSDEQLAAMITKINLIMAKANGDETITDAILAKLSGNLIITEGTNSGSSSSSSVTCKPCLPTPTPTTANSPALKSNKNSFEIAYEQSQNILDTIGFGEIKAEAAGRPNSMSDLTPEHLEFLNKIAKKKGYDKYKDGGRANPDMVTALNAMISASGGKVKVMGAQQATKGYRTPSGSVDRFFDPSGSDAVKTVFSSGLSATQLKSVEENYLARAKHVAPPFWSEHTAGYAVDVGYNGEDILTTKAADTSGYKWMKTEGNAAKFGFVESYPKNYSKGAGWEPWHWRFVGNATYKLTVPLDQMVVERGDGSAVSTSGSTNCVTSSTTATGSMAKLLEYAKKASEGKKPDSRCLFHVNNYIDAVGFGKLPKPTTRLPLAYQYGEFLIKEGKKYGITNLLDTNPNFSPYDAPPGSIVVVTAGSPGTNHPTAGDIAVADGNGKFYNGGEMAYQGKAAWNGSVGKDSDGSTGKVLGIFVADQ